MEPTFSETHSLSFVGHYLERSVCHDSFGVFFFARSSETVREIARGFNCNSLPHKEHCNYKYMNNRTGVALSTQIALALIS